MEFAMENRNHENSWQKEQVDRNMQMKGVRGK